MLDTSSESDVATSRLWLIFAALLPCCASLWAIGAPSAIPQLNVTKDRPALLFATYLYHHGEEPVAPDPILDTRFRFRNEGQETVTFGKIERSCGCMTPRLSHQQLQPGEIGVLSVPVQTINESPGKKEYTLVVHYEDPHPREVTLSIKATFPEKMIMVQPKALYLSQQSDREIPFEVTISDFRDTPLSVRKLTSTSELVHVRQLPAQANIIRVSHTDEQAARFKLSGTLSGNVPPGRHHAVVVAETDDEQFPSVTIPIDINGPAYAEGRAPAVEPQSIGFIASDLPGARRNAQVRVTVPDDWEISHAQAWPPELTVTYSDPQTTETGSKVLDVSVSLTELPANRTQHGVVQLYANEGRDLVTIRTSLLWP